jgi:DNA-binding CsgD family transcriptional regulator
MSEGWAGLFATAFKGSRNAMVLVDDERRHVEVNGAYLALTRYPRTALIGRPLWEIVLGGPVYSEAEWKAELARGDFTGEGSLLDADGGSVSVQFAAHTEVVTGRRLVLCVALSTSRWGCRFRRDVRGGEDGPLSARELEIVHLIAEGQTGPEIAEQLRISHETVRTHVRNAMTKLGARSRAQLVAKSLGDGHALR